MKRPTLRRKLAADDGSILITGLLLMVALLLVIGLAVDMGRAFIVRRDLASIADDAALIGSQQVDQDALRTGRVALNPDAARAAASSALDGEPSVRGGAQATDERVTVTVRRGVQTVLLGLAGVDHLTVSAQATATPRAP
jgi:Flp pilus assembly protein TadG